MTKKYLIVGANGMLGSCFMQNVPPGAVMTGVDLPEIDITRLDSVTAVIDKACPDVVINCAAYTLVDKCETEGQLAQSVNAKGPANLAEVCARRGIVLVHYSTDYVFDGEAMQPYSESDQTGPTSVYGSGKLEGELAVARLCDSHFIIRTAWLYGRSGSNFVETMIALAAKNPTLKVVNDQVGSPTYTNDLVEATYKLVDTGKYGVYHVTGTGACSWFDFAVEIFNKIKLGVIVIPCTTAEFPRPARRPKYGVLSKAKLNALGIYTRPWEEALSDYLSVR